MYLSYIAKVGEDVYNQLSAAKKVQYIRGYAREKDPVKVSGDMTFLVSFVVIWCFLFSGSRRTDREICGMVQEGKGFRTSGS